RGRRYEGPGLGFDVGVGGVVGLGLPGLLAVGAAATPTATTLLLHNALALLAVLARLGLARRVLLRQVLFRLVLALRRGVLRGSLAVLPALALATPTAPALLLARAPLVRDLVDARDRALRRGQLLLAHLLQRVQLGLGLQAR